MGLKMMAMLPANQKLCFKTYVDQKKFTWNGHLIFVITLYEAKVMVDYWQNSICDVELVSIVL